MEKIAKKYNSREKRGVIMKALGMGGREDGAYTDFIRSLYKDGMSGPKISDYILRETGIGLTARSIQRTISGFGETRTAKTAFQNAIDRGRVEWQMDVDAQRRAGAKHQLSRGLRLKIIERDGGKCVICGAKELLQVDHIKARVHGGDDSESNLRCLCIDCNIGKRILYGEKQRGGGLVSGR